MVLSFFLILTLFTTTVISHITSDANFYYLAHPTKRHNGLGSACKQASDCHHLHGARPKCEKGKCTFGWCYFLNCCPLLMYIHILKNVLRVVDTNSVRTGHIA